MSGGRLLGGGIKPRRHGDSPLRQALDPDHILRLGNGAVHPRADRSRAPSTATSELALRLAAILEVFREGCVHG